DAEAGALQLEPRVDVCGELAVAHDDRGPIVALGATLQQKARRQVEPHGGVRDEGDLVDGGVEEPCCGGPCTGERRHEVLLGQPTRRATPQRILEHHPAAPGKDAAGRGVKVAYAGKRFELARHQCAEPRIRLHVPHVYVQPSCSPSETGHPPGPAGATATPGPRGGARCPGGVAARRRTSSRAYARRLRGSASAPRAAQERSVDPTPGAGSCTSVRGAAGCPPHGHPPPSAVPTHPER